MCGNALTQRFLAFPDHGDLLLFPSHHERIVSRDVLRSDDGLPGQMRLRTECSARRSALYNVSAIRLATVHQS